MIYIRDKEGSVALARLGERTLMAHWQKHWRDREVVTEWTLTLEGKPIAIEGVLALHRFDEFRPNVIEGVRRDDGKWQIDIPMAWHTTCVEVSGTLHISLDEETLAAELREDFHAEV